MRLLGLAFAYNMPFFFQRYKVVRCMQYTLHALPCHLKRLDLITIDAHERHINIWLLAGGGTSSQESEECDSDDPDYSSASSHSEYAI